tara:strand:+ start:621 stop:836 length:216 start_codon:yes stop_codon:yes gene_type:complete
MSRALTDIVLAYKNMDIENLNMPSEKTESKGLLNRTTPATRNLDYSSPAVRVGMQMQTIRKYREQNKNDSV